MEKEVRETLQAALEAMRKRMKENIRIMGDNNKVSSGIIKTKEPSSERSKLINGYAIRNNELSKENNELLRMHSDIIKYLNTYLTTAGESIESEDYIDEDITIQSLSADEVFEMVIEGEIEVNDDFLLLPDKGFMNKLLAYYQEIEEYEKCAEIVALMKNTEPA